MLKFPARSKAKDHLYRDVFIDAVKLAWKQRRFWPLAFFASILLSMGSYDVFLNSSEDIAGTVGAFFDGSKNQFFQSAFRTLIDRSGNFLDLLTTIQILSASSIVLIGLAVFSCICQGGLVFALGAWHRGETITRREALRVGTAAMWPVIALNALSLMTLYILRFLVATALYLVFGLETATAWYIYLISYVFFLAASFFIAIVQIFALNALILQGAPVGAAVTRGYELFKKHWLITLEVSLVLFLTVSAFSIFFGLIASLFIIPFTLSVMTSALFDSQNLYYAVIGTSVALLCFGAFAVIAFITQLQYAVWTLIYRRVGEGGVIAKLHRLYRDVTGTYKVPQA